MRAFLDSSVLVPVFFEDHPRHEPSFSTFAQCDPESSYCAAHSLAELYATLTAMPIRPRISPDEALLFGQAVEARLSTVPLEGAEYSKALENAAAAGVRGRAVFDYL